MKFNQNAIKAEIVANRKHLFFFVCVALGVHYATAVDDQSDFIARLLIEQEYLVCFFSFCLMMNSLWYKLTGRASNNRNYHQTEIKNILYMSLRIAKSRKLFSEIYCFCFCFRFRVIFFFYCGSKNKLHKWKRIDKICYAKRRGESISQYLCCRKCGLPERLLNFIGDGEFIILSIIQLTRWFIVGVRINGWCSWVAQRCSHYWIFQLSCCECAEKNRMEKKKYQLKIFVRRTNSKGEKIQIVIHSTPTLVVARDKPSWCCCRVALVLYHCH